MWPPGENEIDTPGVEDGLSELRGREQVMKGLSTQPTEWGFYSQCSGKVGFEKRNCSICLGLEP